MAAGPSSERGGLEGREDKEETHSVDLLDGDGRRPGRLLGLLELGDVLARGRAARREAAGRARGQGSARRLGQG